MLRAVLDASVWVRGTISRTGASGFLIHACHSGQVEIVISRAIINETYEVLLRRHIQRRRRLTNQHKRRTVRVMAKQGILVSGSTFVDAVTEDADDNTILSAALEGNVNYISSEDNHLLSLKAFRGIPILNAASLARLVRESMVENGHRA